MTMLDREVLLSHLERLPSLPQVVSELLTSFASEEVDVGTIAEQIAHDQALAARVLRVANSSFYGLQCKVGTINEAVVVLGFRAVRSMVLAVGVNGVFKPEHCPGFDSSGYLRHCVGVGMVARQLAPGCGHSPEQAFVGGVLHDIGQLLLADIFPVEFGAALAYRQQHDCHPTVAERDVLGIDHAEVGGLLAQAWRFPAALHEAIAEHHAPASALAGSLANLIHVADAIAHGLGLMHRPDELVMPVDRTAWNRLGLDGRQIAKALPAVMTDFEETCQALGC